MNNGSLYGNFRQKKFTDIYPSATVFFSEYSYSGLQSGMSREDINIIYYLLYANYGNSVIASSDTNRFKYQMWYIIYAYGTTWKSEVSIQDKLRELISNEEELLKGTTQINNQAYNPGTAPSAQTLNELEAINSQVVTKYKKDKMGAYATLIGYLDNSVTERFVNRFKKLFLTIIQPELPLWYVTEENEGE